MDLLWADMYNYGILPLLGCVTRLHPMIYGHDGKDFHSEGLEALSDHEARQFLRHTARVRSVRVMHKDHHLHLLTTLPIGVCVFPRLLALTWYPGGDTV
ncbi:hypothetical protein M405DRAFT_814327 [Rhizopogon salebrosus TDB-379]|nr:hypothetical protein M405DRAFT_814327 [Rhizopogon salebrosus TDB-379]